MTTVQQQSFAFGATPTAPIKTPAPPPRRNLVIEAGAGTGKTTAIVAEVLKLMLGESGVSPERIVLMTFTDKAAGEIADRIHAALAELEVHFDDERVVWPVGSPHPLLEVPDEKRGDWRQACSRQLASIHLLRSQTIHSFCQSLLRQFPIEAGLDPQFKIIEGFERSLLYSELYDAWVDEDTRTKTTAESIGDWQVQLDDAGYLFIVRERIFALLERRDLLKETALTFGELSDFDGELREKIRDIQAASLTSISDPVQQKTLQYIKDAPLPPASVDEWISFFAPVASALSDLNLPRGKANTSLNQAISSIRGKSKTIHDRLIAHKAAMALVAMTRRFVAFLDQEKRQRGVVDFDDLLLRTVTLLDDESVLAQARQQYQFLFVDEFQDTDRTQARIIDRLARDSYGNFVQGKTILVGDPKQSIYGFRRADLETYGAVTAAMERAGAEKRQLSDQYRSDPPLLAAVNAMFERVFPESPEDPNVSRPSYSELRSARTQCLRELDARITFLEATCDENADRHLVEAEAIARWIVANRETGGSDLRRFAILFRRLTIIDDYLDVFERYDIDYVLPPARLFLNRPAPVAILAVLRAVAYSFDRGAQISAARSPYFALTDEEIVRGVLDSEDGEIDGSSPWFQFRAAIAGFREISRHLTVSQLIDRILETTDIERVYKLIADRQRSLRHLEHLRALAFEYDRRTGGSVRQFVDEIASRRNDPDEMEPLLVDESRNAIRILTVHAAKGLEFETVILPDIGFAPSGSETAQLLLVEEPQSLVLCSPDSISANYRTTAAGAPLKKVRGQRDEAETRRLFYVAVTRAKTDVVFVHNVPKAVKETSFYKCLEHAGLSPGTIAWPAEGREVRTVTIGSTAVTVALESLPAEAISSQKRARLRNADLETEVTTSPVAPVTVEMPAGIETLSPADAAVARARGRNREAGILLHRFLEVWDGTSLPAPLLEKLGREAAASDDTMARVRQRIDTISRSVTMQRILRAETIGREMPIRYADDSGAVVEKRVDRLIREDGREIVVDYKSGSPDANRLESDRAQVIRYCAAIAAMTGRPCAGILWYIDLEVDAVVEVE